MTGACPCEVLQKLSDKEVELLTAYAKGRGEVVGHAKEGLFTRSSRRSPDVAVGSRA